MDRPTDGQTNMEGRTNMVGQTKMEEQTDGGTDRQTIGQRDCQTS